MGAIALDNRWRSPTDRDRLRRFGPHWLLCNAQTAYTAQHYSQR